jgi:hypothetical protein
MYAAGKKPERQADGLLDDLLDVLDGEAMTLTMNEDNVFYSKGEMDELQRLARGEK